MQDFVTSLDTPLLRLPSGDDWTLADACQGTVVFGGTGAGKTTGTGQKIAVDAFLRSGMGGLVLCGKPEEADRWERYAKIAGRSHSVARISPGTPFRCNFLDYGLIRDGLAASEVAVDVLMRAVEATRLSKDRPSGTSAQFWEDSSRQLLGNAVSVVFSAWGRITMAELYRFISSAPASPAQAEDAKWQRESFFFQTMVKAFKEPVHPLSDHELGIIAGYWRFDFAQLHGDTKSNIVITVTSMLSRFLKGRLHDLFCTHTTFVPEMAFDGTVFILDMPVKQYDADGVIAAHLVKYLMQRAIEARAASDASALRPIFIWADEAQLFLSSYDPEFQSTARSSRACTVYLTQSLPGLYARMGGTHPQHYADMLLSNFITKIFHSNGCKVTNQWAAETLGQRIVRRRTAGHSISTGENTGWNEGKNENEGHNSSSGSSSGQHYVANSSSGSSTGSGRSRGCSGGESYGEQENEGWSEQVDWKIRPDHFSSKLRTGGKVYSGFVDAIWHQSGRLFLNTGETWTLATFKQG